ncbi:hypothetical protein PAL_GLEAN10024792 [Pteropus alecto]|uniref:Uncharacterized protein n=1 Tax=Pteropus alecto TaxID=9402 RepID=L5K122_PTEAL|nr:hypothetical protein PAL_GLEAN10024792 [Pteropus alecto]
MSKRVLLTAVALAPGVENGECRMRQTRVCGRTGTEVVAIPPVQCYSVTVLPPTALSGRRE